MYDDNDYDEINTDRLKDDNRDPISGTPGAHAVGTGLGATGGALAGAAIGAVGGPIGAGIGLAAGAVAGGLGGKAIAENIDPTAEDAYWRENYSSRPYVEQGDSYDVYEPGYRTAYENYGQHQGKTFDEAEDALRLDYERRTGTKGEGWEKGRYAARDAWQRIEDYVPGDSDRDGH